MLAMIGNLWLAWIAIVAMVGVVAFAVLYTRHVMLVLGGGLVLLGAVLAAGPLAGTVLPIWLMAIGAAVFVLALVAFHEARKS